MAVKPIPDGYHTVTPYLIVKGADELIGFLKDAFGAQELSRMNSPDGTVAHAEVQLGDSRLMISEGSGQWPPQASMLHLYIENVDSLYERALTAGASSISAPADQFYGDRMAGILDPSGNQWWLATHVEDVPSEELNRRAAEAMAARG